MPPFNVISIKSTSEIVLSSKINYKKEKMKGGLSWMTNMGNEVARFLMGTFNILLITDYVIC